jgi:hypothetical protein
MPSSLDKTRLGRHFILSLKICSKKDTPMVRFEMSNNKKYLERSVSFSLDELKKKTFAILTTRPYVILPETDNLCKQER